MSTDSMSHPTRQKMITFPFAQLTPHRLESFFDAVFAIIMTILVLGLALPDQSDPGSINEICIRMLPQIIHFAVAFFILAAFWGAHHRLFTLVRKLDGMFIRQTFILLFIACLLPFTSTLAGDNHTNGSAVILFHINMLFLGLLFLVQWIYVQNYQLISPLSWPLYRFILIKSSIVPCIALLGIGMSFLSPEWSSVCYFFIPILEWALYHESWRSMMPGKSASSDTGEPVVLTIPNEIEQTLVSVAHEMEISKEHLIIQILKRWKNETRVNTGSQGSLCHFSPEIHTDASDQLSTDINR